MAYGPQSVSLTREAGGDLDLLEAMRGRGNRIKTQQEMLREQSMSPVEIGSYNGIQGKFPISQGINKIVQGLLATYMESQARDKAQAAADAQKDEAQKFAEGFAGTPAVQGSRPNTPEEIAAYQSDASDRAQGIEPYLGRAPVGDELPTPPIPPAGALGLGGQPAREAPTQAQRTARIMQGMGSTNSLVNRMATYLSDQDATDRARQDVLDARAFQAGQQRELIAANRDVKSAETQPARDETQRLIAQDKQHSEEAVEFGIRYGKATPDERAKMLIEAQFSANPHLVRSAARINETETKKGVAATAAEAKAMHVPPQVNSQYTDQLALYKTGVRNTEQLDKSIARLDSGELKFDRINNAKDSARIFFGVNDEQSRAKAEYQNDVKRFANDVLTAAKGTQTEGDAKRAYDQIVGNINDPDIVRVQLTNLRRISMDHQNTAGTSINNLGRNYPGLSHEKVEMRKASPEPAPKPAPADGAKGTQGNPTLVKTIAETLNLPPGTFIKRPDGTIGQVPPR